MKLKGQKRAIAAAAIAAMKRKGKLWPKGKKGIRRKGLYNKNLGKKISLTDKMLSGKITTKSGRTFTVKKEGAELTFTDKKGKVLQRLGKTKKDALDAYANRVSEKSIKLPFISDNDYANPEKIARAGLNPRELRDAYNRAREEEKGDLTTRVISENLGRIKKEEFDRYGDRNLRQGEKGMVLNYFAGAKRKEKALPIDIQAQNMSRIANREISPNDIVDFITSRGSRNTNKSSEIAERYQKVTGLPITTHIESKITKTGKILGIRPKKSQIPKEIRDWRLITFEKHKSRGVPF